jgi:CubicO group peptidase (beta-lactamase class C family)
MSREITRLIILLAVLVPVAAPQRKTDFSVLEKAAVEELKATNAPGAAVAIVEGDKVIFAKGFGSANVETGAPVTPDMLFRLGSTTKMMTAAALVGLAEEGRFKLDEPVGKYVKGLSPGLARLTAHQLLSHTAGLRDEAIMQGPHDDSALGARVRGWTDDFIIFEPGRIYSYSNPGYALAGLLLEEVGGKPYADVMAERVFQPLGMKRTTLRPTMAMTWPLAQGHGSPPGRAPEIIRPAADYAGGWPAGSVFTSAEEFARFAIAFMNGGRIEGRQAISPAVIAKLSEPNVETYGEEEARYGYGLMITRRRGVRLLRHGGSRAGYGSMVAMAPEQRVAVIILGNRTGASLPKTAETALELMLALQPVSEEKPKPVPMTATEMAGYCGVYASAGDRVEIFARDGRLFARRGDGEVEVSKLGDRRFVTSRGARLALVPGSSGRAEYLILGGRARRLVKP